MKLWQVVQSRPALWLVRPALLVPPDVEGLLGELLGEAGELPLQAARASDDIKVRAHTSFRMRPGYARLDPAEIRADFGVWRPPLSSPAYGVRGRASAYLNRRGANWRR